MSEMNEADRRLANALLPIIAEHHTGNSLEGERIADAVVREGRCLITAELAAKALPDEDALVERAGRAIADHDMSDYMEDYRIYDGQARAAISAIRPHIAALQARAEAAEAIGWLFHNPDIGTEFLENHPVESGECEDATDIREATPSALLAELQSAWVSWADTREEHDRSCRELLARAETAEAANARLREALERLIYETTHLSPENNDGSHWCKISKETLERARAALGDKS